MTINKGNTMSNIYNNYFEGSRISDGWQEHLNRGSSGGIDYAVGVGTPIKAPTDGRISNIPNNGGGGHTVNLHHANGFRTQFMHLSSFVSEVNVNQGDIIGYTGGAQGSAGAGNSTGPHCHTHLITDGGSRVNPLDYAGQDFSGNVNHGSSTNASGDYVIVSGDSYWAIAEKVFGGDTGTINENMKRLQALNGNKRLFAGDTIRLNNDAEVAAAKAEAEAKAKAAADAKAKTEAEAKAKAEAEAKAKVEAAKNKVIADKAKTPLTKKEVKVATKKETFVPVEIPEEVTSHANNIGVIITSAKHRKIAYASYVGVSFLVTNTIVAYSSIEAPIPVWLKVATAIIGNSAIAFGGIAIANVDSNKKAGK